MRFTVRRSLKLIALLICLLLLSACRVRVRVPAGPTAEPTDPIIAVPSDVPTEAPVPTNAVSSANGSATPTVVLPPTATLIAGATATTSPMSITGKGAVVFQLTDATSEVMAALELNPDPSKKELLVNLNDGANSYVDRIRWGGAAPNRERIATGLSLARYAPDAHAIVFNGLLLGDENGANRTAIAPDGVSPAWAPKIAQGDGTEQIVFMRRVPATAPQCVNDAPDSCVSVVVYDVKNRTEKVIATAPNIGGPATWSPDQKRLLISIGGEAGSALGSLEIATGKISVLVPNPDLDVPPEANNYTSAIWSADGTHVIYATAGGALWWLSINDGKPQNLTQAGTEPFMPPGSQWLYYLGTNPQDANPTGLSEQHVWRLDPTNPQGTAVQLLDTPMVCNHAAWSVNADLLACLGTLDNRQTITLYALPTAP